MTHDEMIEVIQALKDGKDLEVKAKREGTKWYPLSGHAQRNAYLNFDSYAYRVKREPRVVYARIGAFGRVCSFGTDKKVIEEYRRQFGGEIVKFVEVMED